MNPIYFKVPRFNQDSVRIEHWKLPHFFDPVHFHEDCQITLIIEGEGTLIAGHSISPFKPGDILLFGKNLPHVLRNDERYYKENPGIQARAISMFFNESIFLNLTKQTPETSAMNNLISAMRLGLKLPADHTKKIAESIKIELKESGPERIFTFLKILNLLSRSQAMQKVSTSTIDMESGKKSVTLNKVFEYILDNYNRQITLKDVSALINKTPNAFCRFFKNRTQKTFFELLIEVRINMVCKLLSEGNLNITETYLACGYNNSSNFHRHFKKVTGTTPREYLQEINIK